MNLSTRLYEDARTAADADQGIGTLLVSGNLHRHSIAPMLGDFQRDIAGCDVAAIVADYRGAALKVNVRGILAEVQEVRAVSAHAARPTALVVRTEQFGLWCTYCYLQGRRGVVRSAFTCPEKARRWAADMAALWAAQARFRAPLQSRR